MLAHEDEDFREWGVSGSLRYDPRPTSELGLRLSVTPSVGASAKGGADALFRQGLPAEPAANDNSVPGLRLTSELDYGFGALGGAAVQTPWAGLSLSESGGKTVRLGWRLKFGPAAGFGIEASRSGRTGAASDRRIGRGAAPLADEAARAGHDDLAANRDRMASAPQPPGAVNFAGYPG